MDMREMREFESAIEKAHQEGKPEIALELARAMSAAMEGRGVTRPPKNVIPTMGESIREEAKSRGPVEQVIAGADAGFALARKGLGGLIPDGPGNATDFVTQTSWPPAQFPAQETSARLPGVEQSRTSDAESRARNTAEIRDYKSLANATPYTIGGNIASNALIGSAVPMGAISAAGRGLGMVPTFMQRGLWPAVDAAMTSGALTAATTPGDAQERLRAGALAAALSSVPVGLHAVGGGSRRMVTTSGRELNVGEGIRRELGGDVTDALIARLRAPDQIGVLMPGRSATASQVSEQPVLQTLETASRARLPDAWRPVDKAAGDARYAALNAQAGTAAEVAQLRAARDTATAQLREQALQSASQTVRKQLGQVPEIQPLVNFLDDMKTGAMRPNRDVQTLVNFVEGEIKQGVTPAQLYEIRKMLTDGIKAGPTSELSQAARAARPQRMEIIKHIDDLLDGMSSGTWRQYLRTYQNMSPDITSKEALQSIISSIERGQPVGTVPSLLAESAAWKTLGNLRDRYGVKEFGSRTIDRMTPQDRELLEAVIRDLKRQSDAMTTKSTLGSQTAPILNASNRAGLLVNAAAGRLGSALGVPGAGSVASALTSSAFDSIGRRAEQELAALLQNPQALATALERAKMAEVLRTTVRQVGGGAGMSGSRFIDGTK